MDNREMISTNSIKGTTMDDVTIELNNIDLNNIDLNNIELNTESLPKPISTTNNISSKINYKKISAYMIFIILIIISMIGMITLILYFINDNFHYCLNENIFNKTSGFINTCISTIR